MIFSYLDGKADARLLVLVNIILQLSLAKFVEGDDDQGHEDVDEEEGEDDEEDNVEDTLLRPVPGDGALVLVCGGHRVLEYSEMMKLLINLLIKLKTKILFIDCFD